MANCRSQICLAEIFTGTKDSQFSKTCCPESVASDIQQIAISREQNIGGSGKATLENHFVFRISSNEETLCRLFP